MKHRVLSEKVSARCFFESGIELNCDMRVMISIVCVIGLYNMKKWVRKHGLQ